LPFSPFPVVVDRFYLMKPLNTRLTQLRTEYQKGLSAEMRSAIKGSRWLLVRNRSELSALEEAQLNNILELYPELRALYLLKEEFRCIFEKVHDRQKTARFLSAWILKARLTGNKYLAKFITTLRNWWEEILNQQRLCHMAMVVLVEDKTNQVGPKKLPGPLRRWFSGNADTIRCLPTFQEVADIMGLDYQTLNRELLVALES
jgi:hypothetical protein